MPLDQATIRPIFRKLRSQLSDLATKPTPENVHRFRTSSRRAEALLTDLARKLSGNDKKLLKLLGRLRKKAGRVRDLDVQTAALRSLKIPQEPVRKSQLLRALAEERGGREKKLVKTLDKKTIAELRRRLKRTARDLEIPKNVDPVAIAMGMIARLEVNQSGVTEETLHRFRIAGKRARYVAELAGKNPDAASLAGQLRHMQDAIGDWHDWAQLQQRAEKQFGGAQDSALVSALRNVTRAKFRLAVSTLTETRSALVSKKLASSTPMGHPHARPGSAAPAAAA